MLFSSYTSFASIINTLASYRIGSNPINLESMSSFAEANLPLSLSLSQPRQAPSIPFYRDFACITLILLFLIVHLSVGV
jgi:hypothetical protein